MTTLLCPTPLQLGGYYNTWIRMYCNYVIISEFFEGEWWFQRLEHVALQQSTRYNDAVDMLMFIEIFWYGLPLFNFDVYMIVRETIHFII